MPRRWIFAPPVEAGKNGIAWDEFCGSACITRLLQRKQFGCRADIDAYLWPRLRSLADPFLLPNMDRAVARIFDAIDSKQRIVLFGDYDVDGVTSLALLHEIFAAYGATPTLFLPLRMEEGYGLSAESVERCYQTHRPDLLIAVDCGTSSVAEIENLKQRGVDVLVFDHHEPKSSLPECIAIVNPKASGSDFAYLCSAGLAFKVCHAMLKARPLEFDLKSLLDLVALGTVADIVPLQHENRTLVHRGALEIAATKRVGLRELLRISGITSAVIAEHIGFRLGPRLNAAGRLANAERSLRLLLTKNPDEARQLADELDMQNRERQEVEKQIVKAAEEKLANCFDAKRDAAIVLGEHGWHPGVLGIVASRIAKKYHRPTIIIGFDENGVGKGSGRSIEGMSIVQALTRCTDLLDKYGGHEMAAGLTLQHSNFKNFRERFAMAARDLLSDDDLEHRVAIDDEVEFHELQGGFLEWHDLLQPFGSGNPHPVFCARNVEPVAAPRVVGERHYLMRLKQGTQHRRAVYFDGTAEPLPPAPWDIAFRVHADEYLGERRLDMHIHAVRTAEPRA